MSARHTPGPWDCAGGTVFGIEPQCCGCPRVLYDDDGHGNPVPAGEECCGSPVAVQVGPIAECSEANAAFIVRACNSHYELLEALEALTAYHESGGHIGDPVVVLAVAQAAIAKARGEQP